MNQKDSFKSKICKTSQPSASMYKEIAKIMKESIIKYNGLNDITAENTVSEIKYIIYNLIDYFEKEEINYLHKEGTSKNVLELFDRKRFLLDCGVEE